MTDIQSLEELDTQLEAMEATIGGASALAAAFNGELLAMRETMTFTNREVASLSTSIGGGLRRAFDGLVFDGLRASDALKMVAQSIIDNVYNTAMKPVQNAVGGFIAKGINGFASSILPFEKGGSFAQGRVMPFAHGGVISNATNFPVRGGNIGLMGEAGPEAIMPLARGADGRLGVRTQGGGRPVTVVMNISTPDVGGFRRSQSQIAAEASRALARGQRNR